MAAKSSGQPDHAKKPKEPKGPESVSMSNKPRGALVDEGPPIYLRPSSVFADFRNFKHFPTWGKFPVEDDLDLRYYGDMGGNVYGPKRHWCFLAEIVGVVPCDDGSEGPARQ